MPNFEYAVAQTAEDAISLLNEENVVARPLAGGTDILGQLRSGRRQVQRLVDIKSIPEVSLLSYDPNQGLLLGAGVPCCQIYENELVSFRYPGLVDAVAMIGGIQIQGRASVGGNLCNAAPSADAIPPLITLGGTCIIAGPNGRREIPIEKFCTAPGQTTLGRGELLISLRLPVPPPRSGSCYLRFIPRNEMDIAIAGSGASVVLDEGGKRFMSARVALASVAPTPLLVPGVGDYLAGQEVSDQVIEGAAERAAKEAKPISDMRGTARQRSHLVRVLTRRALQGAIQRAREN
jgi:CO/xanthine dehydrogenase FAD-binding subunit